MPGFSCIELMRRRAPLALALIVACGLLAACGADKKDESGVTDTSVLTETVEPAGSQLVATWFFNDTSLDALDSAMRIDRDRDSGWIEFHIERTGSDSWPDGVYEIVVSDGTNELQRSEITIS